MLSQDELIDFIENANEFRYTKDACIEIVQNGINIDGNQIDTIEDYIQIADNIAGTYPQSKVDQMLSTLDRTFGKYKNKPTIEHIIAYTEIYCMYALYPKEVAQKVLTIKREFYGNLHQCS